MITISVAASKYYDVKIAAGLLDSVGMEAAALVQGRKAAVITDETVATLYGQRATASLKAAGFIVHFFAFPSGESSKNGETYLKLLNFLAENHLSRGDLLVALGGGVVGDLAGFAAATYLRGIPYLQVPTTLLAMVDSSVGGKTAIDLPAGKNLAGAFYQPSAVLCDTLTLHTLPERLFLDGCGEVIKYGVLSGRTFCDELISTPRWEHPEKMIARCVSIKRDFVAEDEFDTGSRQLLNLGHTFGHAVEAVSGFSLSHGQSVAIGMAMIARAAAAFGLCSGATRDEITAILRRYRLPIAADLPPQALLTTVLEDKKRRGNEITLVIPREIGNCVLYKIPVSQLEAWIRTGLEG